MDYSEKTNIDELLRFADMLYPKPAPIIYKIFAVSDGNKFVSCNGEFIRQNNERQNQFPWRVVENKVISRAVDKSYTIKIKTDLPNMNNIEHYCEGNYIKPPGKTWNGQEFVQRIFGTIVFKQDKNSPDVTIIEIVINNQRQIFLTK